MTVMPNFRLTIEEARDIATYLKSLRKIRDEEYPANVAFMTGNILKELVGGRR